MDRFTGGCLCGQCARCWPSRRLLVRYSRDYIGRLHRFFRGRWIGRLMRKNGLIGLILRHFSLA